MPLKKKEIETYKKRLIEMRDQINSLLQGTTEEVKKPDEATGYSQHQADQGTDDFDRTISIELTGREFEILKLIDRALEKIEENTYGVCDVSGDDIPKKRLDAVPYATMTVVVQEQREKGIL
ncbi:MAG: General stress protein 16O [Chlamydiae bacterium]|nr:General stress protein 16O [Chlamydiota bacterium]